LEKLNLNKVKKKSGKGFEKLENVEKVLKKNYLGTLCVIRRGSSNWAKQNGKYQ